MLDRRPMLLDEVLPLFKKLDLKATKTTCDVHKSSSEWYITITKADYLSYVTQAPWWLQIHGRGEDSEHIINAVWISYKPIGGNSICFDYNICGGDISAEKEIINEKVLRYIDKWIKKFGCYGQNTIKNFEPLEEKKKPGKVSALLDEDKPDKIKFDCIWNGEGTIVHRWLTCLYCVLKGKCIGIQRMSQRKSKTSTS